jgi:DNA-binding response OmpR family regulator
LNTGLLTTDFVFGEFCLNPTRRELLRGQKVVPLTLREYDLLHFLLRHPGRPFTRGDLLQNVWGDAFDGYEHTVNSHINRLRTKIETDPRDPVWIVTVWGIGYRFENAESVAVT